MNKNPECHGQLPFACGRMRIGLFGGSFDPPHEGHREVSLAALKKLGLDQLWWLVSPINPLKTKQPWPLEKRIAQCNRKAHHPKIKVTGFECDRETFYTVDSLLLLKRRFRTVDFVWIMGADNLKGLHKWHRWREIFRLMPVLIVDRPGYRLKGFSAQARYVYGDNQVNVTEFAGSLGGRTPLWSFLSVPLNSVSSTEIRQNYQVKTALLSEVQEKINPAQETRIKVVEIER